MDSLKLAIGEQYHAGLAMLQECVEKCPDELWTAGRHPRTFWRIAYHAAFFAHFYLEQSVASYVSPYNISRMPLVVVQSLKLTEGEPAALEPYEMPEDAPTPSKEQILEYIQFVDSVIDSTLEGLDLETADSGFFWYPSISKLSHELMNLRHVQGHVGQLSELLMMRGIETRWIGHANSSKSI